jgi:hypothetical protein
MQDGTGAGGRFAAKLKDIADRMKPIVKFFTDHPKIIAIASPRGRPTGSLPPRRLRGFGWAPVGLAIGAALTDAMKPQLDGLAQWLANKLTGIDPKKTAAEERRNSRNLRRDAQSGYAGTSSTYGDPSTGKVVTVPGRKKVPKINLNDVVSGKHHAPTTKPAPHPGTRAHTASVRAHAAMAVAASTRSRAAQPHPGDIVAAIEGRANQIDAAHVPYAWGGGHAGRFTGKVIPMDCSGAVSAALGIDPRVSGDFVNWGSPGDGGSRGVTIYANRTHVLMKINGRFWGTSRSNPGGGPGWIDGGVSAGYLAGFTARHMAGSGSALTATTIASTPTRASRPKTLSASLGGTVARAPSRLVGHTAASGDAGFTQTNDPGEPSQGRQDLMRKFQIGVRLQDIARLLKSARGGQRAQLLAEQAALSGELAGIGKSDTTGTAAIPGADAYLGQLDRRAAEATLTADTGDDLAVAKDELTARQNIYSYAKAHGFSDADIADAARNLKTARDNVDQADQATTALTDQLQALATEMKRWNDTTAQINSVTAAQAVRAMGDMINGQIGGFIDSRARTAGDGSLARA